MTIKTIKETILKLKPIDRIHLVENIMNSLREPDPTIEKAWVQESERRIAEYKSGKVKAISWEEFKRRTKQ